MISKRQTPLFLNELGEFMIIQLIPLDVVCDRIHRNS